MGRARSCRVSIPWISSGERWFTDWSALEDSNQEAFKNLPRGAAQVAIEILKC